MTRLRATVFRADANGRCTLRAAVEETNSNATRDAIIFDLPQPSVIELTFGELMIVQSLDIVGPGARRLTIQRAAGTVNSRIFHTPQTQLLVNIRSLTIRGGNDLSAAGCLSRPTGSSVCMIRSLPEIAGNIGGGIMSSGKLTIVRCLIDFEYGVDHRRSDRTGRQHARDDDHELHDHREHGLLGGADYNEGSLLLVNDTISGNTGTQAVNSIPSGGLGTIRVLNTIIGRDTALGNSLQERFSPQAITS